MPSTIVYPDDVLKHARQWVGRRVYDFSPLETEVLRQFFTNVDGTVFFMHGLPQNIGGSLLAMFSRLKNKRGVRGLFVDAFLPQLLSASLPEGEAYKTAGEFLAARGITNLEMFIAYSPAAKAAFDAFMRGIHLDPEFIEKLVSAPRIKQFLGMFLDSYGHNSIARPTMFWVCFEGVSLLTAKTLEWVRPGTGIIELSTRFVDMSGKDCYPVAGEFDLFAPGSGRMVQAVIDTAFDLYRTLQGESFSGPFPRFLRDKYRDFYLGREKDFEIAVMGETCDVLGNFLPCATLTSLGMGIGGEALQQVLQHLRLDYTPENEAIREAVIREGAKVGAAQFMRHYDPTEWKEHSWQYLEPRFGFSPLLPLRAEVERCLLESFREQNSFVRCNSMEDVLAVLRDVPRGEFDKLPNHFDSIAATFRGVMSFRGWRDLQRQTYCTHYRSLVTPALGFYQYNKPVCGEYLVGVNRIYAQLCQVYAALNGYVPAQVLQYPMVLGLNVRYKIAGNLSEFEFCGWQRSKPDVNHEVRIEFGRFDAELIRAYPWWREIARADREPAYLFARGGKQIPLRVALVL